MRLDATDASAGPRLGAQECGAKWRERSNGTGIAILRGPGRVSGRWLMKVLMMTTSTASGKPAAVMPSTIESTMMRTAGVVMNVGVMVVV